MMEDGDQIDAHLEQARSLCHVAGVRNTDTLFSAGGWLRWPSKYNGIVRAVRLAPF